MADSTSLKIERAAKHVTDLSELLRKERPFALVVETNTRTRERTLRPKKYEAVINSIGVIAGDVIHNIRSSLDHIYWDIVSPRCSSAEYRRIQFPFCEKADRLNEAIHHGFGQRAGTGFYCALRKLRPYEETGGNKLLYLIHTLNIVDKHRLLIPTMDQVKLSDAQILASVPDFRGFKGTAYFSSCIFSWRYSGAIDQNQIGKVKPPTLHIFERELDIPMDVVFKAGPMGRNEPVIPTLNVLVDTARQTIGILREAAASC